MTDSRQTVTSSAVTSSAVTSSAVTNSAVTNSATTDAAVTDAPTTDTAAKVLRWKATVAYDGTRLSGWQSQPSGNTVQDFIEARLAQIFNQPVRIHGSGRTDAGVHAKAHPFHFDASWPHGAEKLLRALRVGLPAALQITTLVRAPADFHARFSATGKRYCYRWFTGYALPWESPFCSSLKERRLDIEAMNAAALPLLGEHDFTAFGANGGDTSAENPVKTLYRLDVRRSGPRITLVTEGSGYLYKMVRTLAGALCEVGLGKIPPESLAQILHSRQRPMDLPTAPARGLWLEKVYYGRIPSAGSEKILPPAAAPEVPPAAAAPEALASAPPEASPPAAAELSASIVPEVPLPLLSTRQPASAKQRRSQ